MSIVSTLPSSASPFATSVDQRAIDRSSVANLLHQIEEKERSEMESHTPLSEDEINATQAKKVSDWFANYGKDYVVHGIVSRNVPLVLQEGYVRSGEEILRRNKKLEFESGDCGTRGTISYPLIDDEALEDLKKQAIEIFDFSNDTIEQMLIEYNEKIPRYDLRVARRLQLLQEGRVRMQLTLTPEGVLEEKICVRRNQIHLLAEDIISKYLGSGLRDFQWDIDALSEDPNTWKDHKEKNKSYYEKTICVIAIDEALPEDKKCHAKLNIIYKIYQRMIQEKKINFSENDFEQLAYTLRNYRLMEPTKINAEIRTYRNAIAYAFGRVRVLRGDAHEVVERGHEKFNFTPGKPDEYALLRPWENKGDFFSIDLSDPKVLIVGPKIVLASFIDNPKLGRNIVFTENLTEDSPIKVTR